MVSVVLAFTFAVMVVSSFDPLVIPDDPILNPLLESGACFQGKCYYVINATGLEWEQHREFCKNQLHPAADSAIIRNQETQEFIMDLAKKPASRMWAGYIWIGLYDAQQEGTFKWVDGSDLTYTNWQVGSPNEDHWGEDCVNIFLQTGYWRDIDCRVNHDNVLCELDIADIDLEYSDSAWKNVRNRYMQESYWSQYCDFVGQKCPEQFEYCYQIHKDEKHVCSGHGKCIFDNVNKASKCKCEAGYDGVECETDLTMCLIDGKQGLPYRDTCIFYFNSVKKRWWEARSYCKQNVHPAADLPVMRSWTENKFYSSLSPPYANIWIGFQDIVNEGSFRWIDNMNVIFTYWRKAPIETRYGNDCVQLMNRQQYGSKWFATNCYRYMNFFCVLDIADVPNEEPVELWKNVEYANIQKTNPYAYCDIRYYSCPFEFESCNGIHYTSPMVCNGRGSCTLDEKTKLLGCICNEGFSGIDCEINANGDVCLTLGNVYALGGFYLSIVVVIGVLGLLLGICCSLFCAMGIMKCKPLWFLRPGKERRRPEVKPETQPTPQPVVTKKEKKPQKQ